MTDEYLFAVLFVLIFLSFWSVRYYYIRKTRDPNAPRSRKERREAMRKEGVTGIALVILTPIEILVIIVYVINPHWGTLEFLMVPDLVRWLGLLLLLVSIPMAAWVHHTLGKAYSYALETKTDQSLITSGPFSRVRHPLYLAHNIFNLGMVILTLNIQLIIIAVIGVPLTYTRMNDEERMMITQFGSEYEEYMKRSGRIFPKLGNRSKKESDV